MTRLTRLTFLLLTTGFVLASALLMLVYWPVSLTEAKVLVRVPPGASLRVAAQTLNAGGVQVSPWIISGVGRLAGLSTTIKAGSYEFDRGISLWSLLRKLSSGDTSQGDVLFVEGISFRELRARLNAQPDLVHSTQALSDQAIMARLGVPDRKPEGWFFPDTYRFDKRTDDNPHRRKYLRMGMSNGQYLGRLFQRDTDRHAARDVIGVHGRQHFGKPVGKTIKIKVAVRINKLGHGKSGAGFIQPDHLRKKRF